MLAETEAKVVSAVPPRIVDIKGAQGEVVGRIAEVVGGVRPVCPGITGTADGNSKEGITAIVRFFYRSLGR